MELERRQLRKQPKKHPYPKVLLRRLSQLVVYLSFLRVSVDCSPIQVWLLVTVSECILSFRS